MRRFWRWAKSNPLFWSSVFLLVASAGFVLSPWSSDFPLRAWGMVLQLLGVGTVYWDLASARSEFGKPNWWVVLVEWFKSYKGRAVAVSAEAILSLSVVKARSTGHQRAEDDSIEARLKVAESNINHLAKQIQGINKELDELSVSTAEAIRQEERERAKEVASLHGRLEKVAVGNSALLAFGALWLAIGVVLSTMAPDIWKHATTAWS